MLVTLCSFVWVVVKWVCLPCENLLDHILMICVLFCMYVVVKKEGVYDGGETLAHTHTNNNNKKQS